MNALSCHRPFDWPATLAYLAARAVPGVEAVTGEGRYWRTVCLDDRRGWISIGTRRGCALELESSPALEPLLDRITVRARHQFDLDARPREIGAHLSCDPLLAPLVAKRPGLRVAGAFDGFELAVRAVLGQQVTVRAATTLAGRLAALVAEPLPGAPAGLTQLPFAAERLAGARLEAVRAIGLTHARARTLLELARAVADGKFPELVSDRTAVDPLAFIDRLRTLPGIGVWTAEYVAMRALRWTDAFPAGDLGLRKAAGGVSAKQLRASAEPWRPWRAYAAQHLWASLADRD